MAMPASLQQSEDVWLSCQWQCGCAAAAVLYVTPLLGCRFVPPEVILVGPRSGPLQCIAMANAEAMPWHESQRGSMYGYALLNSTSFRVSGTPGELPSHHLDGYMPFFLL